ncbi:hypothetical protein GM661_03540 [Iocasia frigidifontis]|uniref:Uncharacterized protein n=1 Tax=Iocasia fonsfrigidae TaxID=2682810 RepID=A0A8A7KGV9_9FIRM|nr:hypothetical protein [Iocasia fonsfrigidae]QTL97112.1 hypothetical protein GM661_03540 [Iocasia fonsfrigidae]
MKKAKIFSVLIIIFLIITLSSCAKQSKNSNLKPDESKQTINAVEELEMELIDIMGQIDLIPYYEKQIKEKKEKEKGQKKQQEKPADENKEEGSGEKAEGKEEEFKPQPITNNDTLLLELLEQEESYRSDEQDKQKVPDDSIFIWHEINEKINQLHLKWDDLKPELKKAKVSLGSINGFDDALNSLTIASNKNKFLKTLMDANGLTLYMPQFIKDLKDKKLASLYAIKYHTRQIILNVANSNYLEADKNFKALKNEEKILTAELTEKKFKELLDKLRLSIVNLKNALSLQDINVIKIKGSIIVKNLNAIKEKL